MSKDEKRFCAYLDELQMDDGYGANFREQDPICFEVEMNDWLRSRNEY